LIQNWSLVWLEEFLECLVLPRTEFPEQRNHHQFVHLPTKGCFIGQETVARVHFRGRTQRELRGVDWRDLQPLEGTAIANGERTLGEIHSVLELPDRRVALGMVRREAAIGDTVTAGGREARIVALPLDLADQVA